MQRVIILFVGTIGSGGNNQKPPQNSNPNPVVSSPSNNKPRTDENGNISITASLGNDPYLEDAESSAGMTFPSFSIFMLNYPPDVNGVHAHPSKDNYPNQCSKGWLCLYEIWHRHEFISQSK